MIGHVLGQRFEVLERAGAGAMGTVYRGRDQRTGAPVAIKVLHDLSDAATARFTDEIRALQTLAHPGIVELRGHGRLDPVGSQGIPGAPWMAMEWVEGGDLASALARGWEPSLEEATALARRIGQALGAAHSAGVIHRDVKPANIMLPEGDPASAKLVDFGIAAARAEDVHAASAGGPAGVVGTPDYMAPEQAHGDVGLDARADVYALGTVLFECLTSTTPFQGERGLGILAQKLFDEPPRANAVLADFDRLPDALDDLIARTLSRERAVRPRDGDAFVNALDAALGETSARGTERATLRTLTSRERRTLAVLAVRVPEETRPRRLTEALEGSDFRLEPLRRGLWVAALHGSPGASPLAERAREAAQRLVESVPGARVTVALGKGEIGASGWAGEPFARAVELAEAMEEGGGEEGGEDRVLLDAAAASSRTDEEALPPPCVGRDTELARLASEVSQASALGRGHVVTILGAPGTGKSLLLKTWLARREAQGAAPPALTLRGRERDSQTPHAAVAQALLGWFGAQPGALISRRRRALRARLEALAGHDEAEELAPWLGELAGLDFPARGAAALEAARQTPSLMLTRTAHALGRWLNLLSPTEAGGGAAEGRATPQPTPPPTIVVEDGHWVDGATLQLLEELLRGPDSTAVVVLVARPSLMRRSESLWASEFAGPPLQLGPLDEEEADQLVRATWAGAHARGQSAGDGVTGPNEHELEHILARAEGNPHLLVELTRWLAAGNPAESAPETALELAATRLAGLTADERRAMRAAAVFGRRFSEGGAAALLGGASERASVRRWLYAARAKHLIQGVAPPPNGGRDLGPWYEMASQLLVDAAYDTLPDEDRRAGHGLALAWLQAKGATDGALLGRHALAAGAFAEAAAHFLTAAARAARVGDDQAARGLLSSYARALDLGGVPRDSTRWAEIWAMEAELDLAAGAVEEAAASARAAMDAARRGASRTLLARGLLTLGRAHLRAGAWGTAVTTLVEARQVAETLSSASTQGRVALALGEALSASDPRQSLASYNEAMRALESVGEQVGVATCLRGVAEVALRWGDPEAATVHAREALALLRPLGASREIVGALSTLGEALAVADEVEAAAAALDEAREHGAGMAPRALVPSHLARGRAMFAMGAYAEARGSFEAAGELAAAGDVHGAHLEACAGLACCALNEEGAGASWHDALSRALTIAEDHGLPPGPAAGLLMMAASGGEAPLSQRVRTLVARARSTMGAAPTR